MDFMDLTDAEIVAKDYMIRVLTEGTKTPCDNKVTLQNPVTLPSWYDDQKFKRGQKYFFDNRLGMIEAKLCGLIILLSEPKGLKTLISTGKSSTPETARKRYASTIIHVMSWYESDLKPGSQSWKSLAAVRQMHFNASEKNTRNISQTEIALTTFGFMGFALVRANLLGIRNDVNADREGFVHFWAVIGHMLGVADSLNMCYHSLDVVEIICKMLIRYLFLPLLQIESKEFKYMASAVIEGMAPFLKYISYENELFAIKRLLGIPGYQYNVNMDEEYLCKQIFSDSELQQLLNLGDNLPGYLHFTFDKTIPILTIQQHCKSNTIKHNGNYNCPNQLTDEITFFNRLLNVDDEKTVVIERVLTLENYRDHLSDSKYYELCPRDQQTALWYSRILPYNTYRFGKFFCEIVLNGILFKIRNYHQFGRNDAKKYHPVSLCLKVITFLYRIVSS